MRIVAESHVPERVRIARPVPTPPPSTPARPPSPTVAELMPEIVKTLTKIVQDAKPAPIVLPAPATSPKVAKAWKFSINRDEDGLITDITATRVD